MKRSILNEAVVLMLTILVSGCFAGVALAQDTEEVNTGMDFTKPLTRIDVRMKYQDLANGYDDYVMTLRADKPFVLAGGWILSTRLDLPVMWSNVPSLDNTGGDMHFGLSDTLLQLMAITPPLGKKWAVAFGTQVIFPTATEGSLGTGKFQLVPLIGAKYDLSGVTKGSFAALLVRHAVDIGGDADRPHINRTTVQPIFNLNLPKQWFIVFEPEYIYDWNENESFLALDTLVGKMITKNIVLSLEYKPAVVRDLPLWEHEVEFRIGFFF